MSVKFRLTGQPVVDASVGQCLETVPGQMKTVLTSGGLNGQPCAIALKKGVELDQVGIFILRIDLPDHGLCGPLCADERVLATDEIDIAKP